MAALNPALAAATLAVSLWRKLMNSLIWQSVMWRPGKMAVPHQREEPASYPAGRDRQPTRAFQGRAVRRIRNVSRATPSRRHASGDTFSSRLTLPSHPDCRAACFSFYVTKNMTTGEGGMILTMDEKHADRLKILALHGMSKDAWRRFSDEGYKHYYVVDCGYKYNMMDIQAAIGIHQLRRIEMNWKRRQEIWAIYQRELSGLPLTLPAEPDQGTRHAYHLYTVLVDSERARLTRDQFISDMTAENIGVGVHYQSIPVHPYYQERFGWRPEDYPHSLRIGHQTVSLPLSAKLTDRDVSDVVDAVRKVLSH